MYVQESHFSEPATAPVLFQQQQKLVQVIHVEEELEELQFGCFEGIINNKILQRVIFIHSLINL